MLGGMRRLLLLLFLALSVVSAAESAIPQPAAPLPPPHLGYGFNVADLDYALLQNMGFGWVKLFAPPSAAQPTGVLLRVDANAANLADLGAFAAAMSNLAANHGAFIDAYEIGNEPNLDAAYGWAAPPVAQEYATLLCAAYNAIKSNDPEAIVVSAGLAPTGRVSGTWNGHAGHNGLYQDERAFLQELLDAGGAGCFDVVGYHPYGFSADYDAPPDVPSADPRQNCSNGFCFRGTEKIHEILVANGLGARKIWATELGWITEPPASCLADPGWQGRQWQIVSEAQQAENLAGAFAYADAHWPWMGGMFVFNLNFNTVGWYATCEQMRFYGVEGRPAEAALRALPKRGAAINARLTPDTTAITWIVAPGGGTGAAPVTVTLENGGWQPGSFSVSVDSAADLVPQVNGGGEVPPTGQGTFAVSLADPDRPVGSYSGTITLSGDGQGLPSDIPVQLLVVENVRRSYLPLASSGQ